MEGEQGTEHEARIELGNFPLPRKRKVWHARLPNFLALEEHPFDELMWESPEMPPPGEADETPEERASREIRETKASLPDENVIRWQWAKDEQGNVVRDQVAPIVQRSL